MKIDYHLHLEEGPYSMSFIEKTLNAMAHFEDSEEKIHTKEWLIDAMDLMQTRLKQGDFSKWWLDFYLQEALNKGIKQVGIVDHLYRFKETKDYFHKYMDLESEEIGSKQAKWLEQVMVSQLSDFVTLISSAKEEWAAKGIELKLGIEADYFVGGEAELQSLLSAYDFDFIIGSIHFYDGWGFDNPTLQHKFDTYNLNELYTNHFETVKKAAASGLFDFIAHLDNLKVFKHRPAEESLIENYKDVAKTLVKYNVATEVNPGLLYRYPVKEMCPSPLFTKILIEEGVKFTTSSDSHFPNDLGIYQDKIQQQLFENGLTELATFTKRKRIMVPFTP